MNNQKLKKDSKDIFSLLGGNALPQILFLVTLPLLSRIYGTDSFGTFAIFSASVVFLQPLLMLTLENALLSEKKEKVSKILLTCLLSTIFISLSCLLVLTTINSFFEILSLDVIFLIFFGGIVYSISRLCIVLSNREELNQRIAKSFLLSGLARVTFPLIAGIIFLDNPLFLIMGFFAGEIMSILILGGVLLSHIKEILIQAREFKFSEYVIQIKEYRKFTFFGSSSTVLINSSAYMPALGIAFLYSPSVVGIYFLADRIVGLPAQFISSAINTFFNSSYSKEVRQKKSGSKSIKQALLYSASISFFFSLLFLFSHDLILFFLGNDWIDVISIINFILFVAVSKILTMPISSLPFIQQKQEYDLYGGLSRVGIIGSALLACFILNLNELDALKIICMSLGLSYLVFLIIYFFLQKNYENNLFKN